MSQLTHNRRSACSMDCIDQIEYEHSLSALREQLDTHALEVAWAAGQAPTIEQAIEDTR